MLSPRDDIGLTAASEGDIAGLHKFINFVSRELRALGLFETFPETIQSRLQSFARDGERLSDFIDGYKSAPISRTNSNAQDEVLSYIQTHPGLRGVEIADAFDDRPERTIRTALHRLKKTTPPKIQIVEGKWFAVHCDREEG